MTPGNLRDIVNNVGMCNLPTREIFNYISTPLGSYIPNLIEIGLLVIAGSHVGWRISPYKGMH